MLFRVKSRNYRAFEPFHYIAVGTVFHSSATKPSSNMSNGDKCLIVFTQEYPDGQYVPTPCLERIPNTKANLRKFAKGLL